VNKAYTRVDYAIDQVSRYEQQLADVKQEAALPRLVAEERSALVERWSNLQHLFGSLREHVLSSEEKALHEAVSYFGRINSERHGSREEITHYFWIYNWYRDRSTANRHAIQACADSMNSAWNALSKWNTLAYSALRRTKAVPPIQRELEIRQSFGEALAESTPYPCKIPNSDTYKMPEPPLLGNSLGSLRFVAGWLLNSASLPLTLIVGLVGFGLLGSVISTFVKEKMATDLGSKKYVSHMIVTDLTGVILRGLSAAIVVFLAVQGGLAVLSGAGSDPNPYVLLLACFVAAVFSERVWQSAYQYLVGRLQNDPTGKAGHAGDVPSSTPPATVPQSSAATSPPAAMPSLDPQPASVE
jgi:hypothetical protein